MKTKSSLPCSQKFATVPHPNPHTSSTQLSCYFISIHFSFIAHLLLGRPSDSFRQTFRSNSFVSHVPHVLHVPSTTSLTTLSGAGKAVDKYIYTSRITMRGFGLWMQSDTNCSLLTSSRTNMCFYHSSVLRRTGGGHVNMFITTR